MAVIRYLVANVDAAIAFYVDVLGFELVENGVRLFAMVKLRGPHALVERAWQLGGTSASPTVQPVSGGWNRLVLETDDLEALVAKLRRSGRSFAVRSWPGRAASGPRQ